MEARFAEKHDEDIVLVCDTGHMSRVAAEIMGEDEGFARVFSLRGGMKAWERWRDKETQAAAFLIRRCCNVDQGTAA